MNIEKPFAPTKSQLFVTIMNSGFPEKEHMDIALKIMRNFAQSQISSGEEESASAGAGL